MSWEDVAAVAIPAVAIAYTRDRRSHAALRTFAKKHGLRFTEARVIEGVLARGEGRIDGKELDAALALVRQVAAAKR